MKNGADQRWERQARESEVHPLISDSMAWVARINQQVAFHRMRVLGRGVEPAESGPEAVEKFTSGRYDVIFHRQRMPWRDTEKKAWSAKWTTTPRSRSTPWT